MKVEGVAVVTGGGSGIGAACCRELSAAGASVVVLDRNLEGAEAVAKEVGGKAYLGDVTDDAGLAAVAAKIEAEVGPVTTLVANAGILAFPARPFDVSMDTWDEINRVDQRGVYLSCVVFGRAMVQRRKGAIVTIASIAGMRSMPIHGYASAKAAVISITQCLATEWGPAGIRVNAVSPGFVQTPALQAAIDKGERDVSLLKANAAMGRTVRMDEIAKAVVFLSSDTASGITGVNLPVDCGWLVTGSWHTYGGLRQPGN
jgi:NAD(P)-dependent dehydrogenase (short-subunit alcohol dehydrogenase family)